MALKLTFILLTPGCFHSMIFFMFQKKSFILSLIVDRDDDDEYVWKERSLMNWPMVTTQNWEELMSNILIQTWKGRMRSTISSAVWWKSSRNWECYVLLTSCIICMFLFADSVFTARIDNNTCDLVITGGQDDTAYVWSASSGETKFQCDGG